MEGFGPSLSEFLKPFRAEGAPMLVGVSGGADSMCLATLVLRSGMPLGIAHCNFQLRGADSDADEDFVRAWAEAHHLPFHARRFPTEEYAREKGISIEMAAREMRYRFFGETARTHGYAAVAVAHHAQDNAETLILNLLRGTGPKGICGMKASGFLPVPEYADIPLLRPLLGFTREEVRAYVQAEAIPFREDRTNAGNDYKRNKLRNLVFPVFRDINPSFIQTLNRDMERFAEAYGTMLSEGARPSEGARFSEGRPTGGDGDTGPVPTGVIPTGSDGGTFVKGAGPVSTRADGGIPTGGDGGTSVKGAGPVSTRAVGGIPNGVGDRPGTSPRTCILIEETWDGTRPVKQPAGILIADADRTGPDPVFRTWQPGDWIRPLGAPGRKKLQDWFTDHHIAPSDKHTLPLLPDPADPTHILAIAGHCIDDSVKVTPRTRRIWRITLA